MLDKVHKTFLLFRSNRDRHLSCRQLADLFCCDVSRLESWAMRRHLSGCAACRARKQHLEGPCADRMLGLYRESTESSEIVLSEWRRAAFSAHLEMQSLHDPPRTTWSSESPRIFWLLRPVPVVLTGALASLVAGVSIFVFVSREREPNITASALLVRAETWDLPNAAVSPGVVRQTVQLKSSSQTLKRSIYWDVQGKRHPRAVAFSASEEGLHSALGRAGADWNRPISASAYQDWHDRQHARADRIARSGTHLLTITTTVPDGIVSEESLTVRDTDYHPVQWSVDFRDHERVEVAELDFAVLPWNTVDADLFDGTEGPSTPGTLAAPGIARSLHGLDIPTDEQLDTAELSARLILNQHRADNGEQIVIHRLAELVEVDGLVETEARRHELTLDLMTVPRLKVSIQSVTHLADNRNPASDTRSIVAENTVLADQPSSLEMYLHGHHETLEDTNAFAGKIFNTALTISQESGAIADLKGRFASSQHLPLVTSATLAELLYSHRERLHDALQEERALLEHMKANSEGTNGMTAGEGQGHGLPTSVSGSLTEEASLNLALVRELTHTGVLHPRRAEAIFAEMSATADRIADAADKTYRMSQQVPGASTNQAGSVR